MDVDVVVSPRAESVQLQRDGLESRTEREASKVGLKTNVAGSGSKCAARNAVVIIGFDGCEDGRAELAVNGVDRGPGAGGSFEGRIAVDCASGLLRWQGGSWRRNQRGGVFGKKRDPGGRRCESGAIEEISALFAKGHGDAASESAGGEAGILQTRSCDETGVSEGLPSQFEIARRGQVCFG